MKDNGSIYVHEWKKQIEINKNKMVKRTNWKCVSHDISLYIIINNFTVPFIHSLFLLFLIFYLSINFITHFSASTSKIKSNNKNIQNSIVHWNLFFFFSFSIVWFKKRINISHFGFNRISVIHKNTLSIFFHGSTKYEQYLMMIST